MMGVSTYKRMKQSAEDAVKHRRSFVESKFTAAGLSWDCGGYPTNPDAETAYNAGFQRGCHWAFQSACAGQQIDIRWDMADSTSAGNGEQDGWNAAVEAMR